MDPLEGNLRTVEPLYQQPSGGAVNTDINLKNLHLKNTSCNTTEAVFIKRSTPRMFQI